MNIQRFALLTLATSMLLPLAVQAESVQWNTVLSGGLCTPAGGSCDTGAPTGGLVNPDMGVTYHAIITNVATGERVIPGATLPIGTVLSFEFDSQASSDIYWFGTGTFNDSPYGDWVAGAARPSTTLCVDKNYISTNYYPNGTPQNVWASLAIAPPTRTLTVSNATCTDISSPGIVSKRCTLSSIGAVDASFNFAPTIGHFYVVTRDLTCTEDPSSPYYSDLPASYSPNPGGALHSWSLQGTYTLQVPQQVIDVPINVGTADGLPPTGLTLSGGGAVQGAGSCTVGTPYQISMRATDPDNDQLRYGVDWDGNGTVDQFLPSTGYVPSGTQESASRTYSTNGTKQIKVLAQDSRGLTSGWVTLSVSCTGQADQSQNQNNAQSNSGSQSLQNTIPSLTLKALPSLLRSGQTTTVSWSASNVLGNSCKVTSPTDTTANGTGSWAGAVSQGVTSSPITQQTTYTLSCTGLDNSTLTQSATINVLPAFREI